MASGTQLFACSMRGAARSNAIPSSNLCVVEACGTLNPKLGQLLPHPVTPIKGYIEPYYNDNPTVTGGGAVPNPKP